jgi:hypothetical protein
VSTHLQLLIIIIIIIIIINNTTSALSKTSMTSSITHGLFHHECNNINSAFLKEQLSRSWRWVKFNAWCFSQIPAKIIISWIKLCAHEWVEIKNIQVIWDVTLLQGCKFPTGGRETSNHKPHYVTYRKSSILNYTIVETSNLKKYKFWCINPLVKATNSLSITQIQ